MIFEMLFNNPVLIIGSMIITYLFMFYALGAIVQGFYSFRMSNRYLAIPLGYILWLIITLLAFATPILLGLDIIWFKLMGVIEGVIIFSVIVLYYKSWTPTFTNVNSRSLIRAPIGIIVTIVAIVIFLLLSQYVPISTNNDRLSFYIGRMIDNRFVFDTVAGVTANNGYEWLQGNKSTVDIIENYESFYYWMAIVGDSVVNISRGEVMEIIIPILTISVISFSILGSTIDSERSFISYVYSSLFIFALTLLEWKIGVNNQMFYILPSLTFSIMLLFTYSLQANPSDNLLTASLVSQLSLVTVTHFALPIIITLGSATVSLAIIKNGEIVRTMYQFIITIAVPIILFVLMSLLSSINPTSVEDIKLGSHIITLLLLIIIFSVIIIPLRSLALSSERRVDLVSFEQKVKNRIEISLITFSVILTLLSLALVYLFIDHDIVELLSGYFLSINGNIYVAIEIYLLVVVIPTFIILIVSSKYKKKTLLSVIPFITLLINPITTVALFNFVGWEYNVSIIILPELIIFLLWGLSELIKIIPDELKI